MLDLNSLRDKFAQYLVGRSGERHSMDGALMYIGQIAYNQGLRDAPNMPTPSEMPANTRRVVSAACRNQHGVVICSPRHWDSTMHATVDALADKESWSTAVEQGFVDQHGVFMDRRESWLVAAAANQIIHRCGGDDGELFSENLY